LTEKNLKIIRIIMLKTKAFSFFSVACVAVLTLSTAYAGMTTEEVKRFADLSEKAGMGDPESQYLLGRCYENGEGVEKDYFTKATLWISKAANQSYAPAQNNMGHRYLMGQGVAQDSTEAVAWYRKAANQGYAKSLAMLGSLYDTGEGVQKDQVKAVVFWRSAAEKGLASAQYHMGLRHSRGIGVAKEDSLAAEWFRKAAKQDYVEAQHALGNCYLKGEGVPKDYSIAEGWLEKAAQSGHAMANYALGQLYEAGEAVPKNLTEAYAYYNIAGATEEKARNALAELEKKLTKNEIIEGQKLSRQKKDGIDRRARGEIVEEPTR
jgi:TPR repeat protein